MMWLTQWPSDEPTINVCFPCLNALQMLNARNAFHRFFFLENSTIISRFQNWNFFLLSIFSEMNSMWYNTNTCNFEKFNISENCGVTRTGEFTSTAESHILLNKDNKANYLLHGYFKEYKAVDWQGTNQSDIQKYMQSIIVSYQLSNVTTILLYNPPVFVWCDNLS